MIDSNCAVTTEIDSIKSKHPKHQYCEKAVLNPFAKTKNDNILKYFSVEKVPSSDEDRHWPNLKQKLAWSLQPI